MTIYTLIYFDDDRDISDMEHFSSLPKEPTDSKMDWALYVGNLDGGDTLCIASYSAEENQTQTIAPAALLHAAYTKGLTL